MYNHEPQDYRCPFCSIARGEETELNKLSDLVFENESVIAFVSPKQWINNPGNVLVIPKEHIENVYDISEELLDAVYLVGKKVALAMKDAYGCEGTSFRQHNEPAGNQDVWHFHLHIFPRWEDDSLYVGHESARYVSVEERLPYVNKLRSCLGYAHTN